LSLGLDKCALSGGDFLASNKDMKKENMENKIPEPEKTPEGKYKCRKDSMEYDTREDYEAHCEEEHTSEW
jgi:hypothetical protein